VGDGRLNYGIETLVEAYYRIQPWKFVQFSLDYQYIVNPGYNQDRGPANVVGLRIHIFDPRIGD
jgi:high affinity Mn2+ porin